MPRYLSLYVPCELAIVRIALHCFRGDETAAAGNLKLAITEGTITRRPDGGFHTKRHVSNDILSNIVRRAVGGEASEDDHELRNWPEGTYLRRELEEVYGQIFAKDGPPIPDGVVYNGFLYQTEQDEARQPDGEQLPTKAEPVELPEHAQPERRPSPVTQPRLDYWRKRETEIRNKSQHFSLLQIAKKIATEGAPDHLTDDQKEDWKKKGWTTENIHRRLKDRP